MRSSTRAGFTLVELLVSLAVLAIGLAIVTGSILRTAGPRADAGAREQQLREARARAVRSGVAVLVAADAADSAATVEPVPVLFLPDGRNVGLAVTRDAEAP